MARKIISWFFIGVLAILVLGVIACRASPQTAEQTPTSMSTQAQQSSPYEDVEFNFLGKGAPRKFLPQDQDEIAVLAAITFDHTLIRDTNLTDYGKIAALAACLEQASRKANYLNSKASKGSKADHFQMKKLDARMESPTIKHFTFLFTFPEYKGSITGLNREYQFKSTVVEMKGFQAKVTITIQTDSDGKRAITNVSC